MYAHLTGTITTLAADSAVLDVHGVGYLVHASSRTLGGLTAGQGAKLLTHLQVREDALTLYGFTDVAEHTIFLKLLAVSGVGPRLALSLLSTFTPSEVIGAISANQPATLARASGVGKKMAEKIIVELKDKLGSLPIFASADSPTPMGGLAADVLSALTNLGYPPKVAEQAVAQATAASPNATFNELLKVSLSFASRG